MNNPKEQLRHRAYKFSISVTKFAALFPHERIYWVISDQLLRAATSIGANIIEAQSASSKKDFINFYTIALKSANETRYWLGILRDGTDLAKKEEIEILLKEAKDLCNMLGASLLTMKGKR